MAKATKTAENFFQEGTATEQEKQQIVNEVSTRPEKPRRIIFQIKGLELEDSMIDGEYLAGKAAGLYMFQLTSTLKNTNDDYRYPERNWYITGLEVEDVMDDTSLLPEEKQRLAADVKTAKAWLEYRYKRSLNPNSSFWRGMQVKVNDLGAVYNTDIKDDYLIMYYNILGGGHDSIARSYEEAKSASKMYYLTVASEEAKRKFVSSKDKIKASGALEDVMDNWSLEDTLFLTYYLVDKKQHGYTKNTPKDDLIQELDDYIHGVDTTNDKKRRPGQFLAAYKLFSTEADLVKITAIFNAALYFGFIITDKSKNLINRTTGFMYGSSKNDAIDKLLDPRNIEELSNVKSRVSKKWND